MTGLSRHDLRMLLARLWVRLSVRRRQQFTALGVLMLISALAEVVSLGAVLPFLAILTSPERVLNHPIVGPWLGTLGIGAASELILPLTVAFAIAALVAAAVRLLLLWASTRVAFASGSDLSIEMYRRALYQPYQVHLARNSSEVISGITLKVSGAVNVLYNSLNLMSAAVLVVAITMALIIIDPIVALVSTAIFGAGYGMITLMTRRRLRRNSQRIAAEQIQVIKALQEGLGGIRDVLLDGTQPVYCAVYARADRPLRRADGNNNFIGGFPRFVMEALGMILIAGLAYALARKSGGLAAALPGLGALALGAQRMLPTLQNAYSAWTGIAANQSLLADAVRLLEQPMEAQSLQPAPQPLAFRDSIEFRGIRFRYGSEAPWVLDGIDFIIRKGARVGIVGATGSGKSTALDVLMGLLKPIAGELLVDGQPIDAVNVRAWQQAIAHVPQYIFLADTTLAENIAFGVPRELINLERVHDAARRAQIAAFIESNPQGYDQVIGERGVRLSGGQRQRIGIARALYKRASVLVFDEATSALDTATEHAVMESIEALDRELTILIIAHRLTTVRNCDMILELAHGRLVAANTPLSHA